MFIALAPTYLRRLRRSSISIVDAIDISLLAE